MGGWSKGDANPELIYRHYELPFVRLQVFTAVTMKNAVFKKKKYSASELNQLSDYHLWKKFSASFCG
jgi:hypothetical protein